MPNLLADGTGSYGSRECLVTSATRLTYAELDRKSLDLAATLVELGAGKGSRVGILFPNGADWVIAWAAAARIGAVVLPVNTFYRPEELRAFLRYADVQYLLCVESFLKHNYLDSLEKAVPELASAHGSPLFLGSLPQLRYVLNWHGEGRPWNLPWHRSDAPRLRELVAEMERDVTPADDLAVVFTSGTTGEPKGVVHTHGGLLRHARNLAGLAGSDENLRIWSPMPLHWVGGLVLSLLRPLSVGGCFVTQEVFEAGEALRLLEQERVTDVTGWPHTIASLVQHPDFAGTDLTSISFGLPEAIPADRRPADASLAVSTLGMSETGGPHTYSTAAERITGSPAEYRGSSGHQVPGLRHRIVDPDTGEELPDGQEGEILVRGYSLMRGVHKRENADVFDADGWYHTGDRGVIRDGWFFFTGRESDLIKTRGANVASGEVEQKLRELPGVDLAFVLGVPDPVDGQQVVALLVGGDGFAFAEHEVRNALREQLSSYKVPRRIFPILRSEVPWLPSQKVDRTRLLARAGDLLVEAKENRMSQPVPGNDHLATVERAVEAYNSCDFETYAGLLTEDVLFVHHNRTPEYRGRDEVITMLKEAASSMFASREFLPATRVDQTGDFVYRRQGWTGTVAADVPGASMSKGDQVSMDLCSVYVFRGSLIAEFHDYG
ncbi:AMP-binding protein [Amycolatopsis jejuensis]|uniref:AMP-binding protein n=1 Tax=Amycolatopsis jejuensis TaxID=330084 RepID=UPI00138E3C83|nr:AMP-binding protein [Amycolatopsis jejuensis]